MWRPRFDRRGAELRVLLDRTREVVVLAAVVGVLAGLGVALFDTVTADWLLNRLTAGPVWLAAAGPLVGLVVAAAALRWLAGGATPSTADEYIKAVPDPGGRFDLRPAGTPRWSPVRRRGSPPSSRPRPPGRSSHSRCPTRTTSPATRSCPP